MYSTPTWRQYASRSRPSTSRSFLCSAPAKPLTLNSRSRSHSVRPCVFTSRSGWLRKRVLSSRSGSMSAIRWPRLRYAAISSRTRAFLSSIESGLSVRQRTGSYGMPSSRKISSKKSSDSSSSWIGAQEVAGLRALDDAVVVGGGERDQLADAQLGDAFLAGALELGRVLHRADADDRALTAHQPRHRVHGADRARVGQRNRHAAQSLRRSACRRGHAARCPRRRR